MIRGSLIGGPYMNKGTGCYLKKAVFLTFLTAMAAGFGVTAYGAEKTITGLGKGTIGNPVEPADKDSAWSGSKVWFGKYKKDGSTSAEPVLYRVLSSETTDYSDEDPTMLLDCDSVLFLKKFDEDGNPNTGAVSANEWLHSDIRNAVNGDAFFTKDGCFTDTEKNAIAESTIESHSPLRVDDCNAWWIPQYTVNTYTALDNDRVFLLDYEDVLNPAYGYWNYSGVNGDPGWTNIGNRVKKNNNDKMIWWLRSATSYRDYYAGIAQVYGIIGDSIVTGSTVGVSPAFNVELSKVLFSSLVSGTAGEPGAEYKLTLSDNDIEIKVPDGGAVVRNGNTFTIPYSVTGEHKDNVSLVSVLVTDKRYYEEGAHVLQYGKLNVNGAFRSSGTGTFTLIPEDLLGSDCHIYILAEDLKGEKETDYASRPFEIRPGKKKVSANVVFKVKNGSWNDGTSSDITVVLSKDDDEDLALILDNSQIPSVGNKPAKGHKEGGWDTDPTLKGTYREGTTTTYTYIYASDGSKPEPTPPEPTPPEPTPPEPTPPDPAPPEPAPPEPETGKTANLNGLTLAGLSMDIRLYGPKGTVSYNGRTHVAKSTVLSEKQKKNKAADLDIGVQGIPGFVSASFTYGNTKGASKGKAWFAVKLKVDKASASYNGLSSGDRDKLKAEIKKINKILKKKDNRVYFDISPLDLSEFTYDAQKSTNGKKVYVRKDGSTDRLELRSETKHYIDSKTYTVKAKNRKVLYAYISGSEFKVSKREYKKTNSGIVIGKNRNLKGTVIR